MDGQSFDGRVVIGLNRGRSALWAVFLGFFAVGIAIKSQSVAVVVIDVLVLGLPLGPYAFRAILGRPVMAIDRHNFTYCRSGRIVAWDEIEAARVNTRQGAFGQNQSLHLLLKLESRAGTPPRRRLITTNATADDELEISLDGLSRSSEDIADAIKRVAGAHGAPRIPSSAVDGHLMVVFGSDRL